MLISFLSIGHRLPSSASLCGPHTPWGARVTAQFGRVSVGVAEFELLPIALGSPCRTDGLLDLDTLVESWACPNHFFTKWTSRPHSVRTSRGVSSAAVKDVSLQHHRRYSGRETPCAIGS